MTRLNQIWKCEVCGNIIEVLHEGADALVCCGKSMVLQIEKDNEEGLTEKHKPVIEGKKVSIGSVLHPMEEKHYIEWIEGSSGDGLKIKKFLKPGDLPIVEFCFSQRDDSGEPDVVSARCYCNLHGLWDTILE